MKYRIAKEIPDWRPADLNIHDHILLFNFSFDPDFQGPKYHSAIWDGNEIHPIPGNFHARSLNDLDQVAGTCEGEAALYVNGAVTKLGPGTIADINNEGAMVGSITINGQYFPCFWRDGIINWQGSEPGCALAINARNDFIFFTMEPQTENDIENGVPEVTRAFVWEDGKVRSLTGPNGEVEIVKPTDINNDGVIIGYIAAESEEKKAYEDNEDGNLNLAHELGYVPLRWRSGAVEVINTGGSLGHYPSRIGPNDFVVGTKAESTYGDIPTCMYADFVSAEWIHDPNETGWNRYNEMMYFDAAVAINDSGHIVAANSPVGCTLLVPDLDESPLVRNPEKTWDDATLTFRHGTKEGWKLIPSLAIVGFIFVFNISQIVNSTSVGKGIIFDVLGALFMGLIFFGGMIALFQMWGCYIEVKDCEIKLIGRKSNIIRRGSLREVRNLWPTRSFFFNRIESYTITFTDGRQITFRTKFNGCKELVRVIENRSGLKFHTN